MLTVVMSTALNILLLVCLFLFLILNIWNLIYELLESLET